jgi:hypothetical protein
MRVVVPAVAASTYASADEVLQRIRSALAYARGKLIAQGKRLSSIRGKRRGEVARTESKYSAA